jgi:uncharacterized membrane protein
MQEDGELVVHDAALIEDEEVIATLDPMPYAAAVPSALIGALIGTLFAGPLGLLIGGIVGAGSGALTAANVETGLPRHVVEELRRTCEHGNHAVALLVSDQQPGCAASFAMRCSALGRSTLLAC